MADEHLGDLVIGHDKETSARSLSKEYGRCIQTLSRSGVISILPGSESLGVVGFDGKECPIPSPTEVANLFDCNKELVREKGQQGFTRLQLVPFKTPLVVLKNRVGEAIIRHAREGKIFQAKSNPQDPDTLIQVNMENPLWIWDKYLTGEQSGGLVYFPQIYTQNHQGVSKAEVSGRSDICAVPGWSIALVEDSPFLPQEGNGIIKGGRKQIENNRTPNDYLRSFSEAQYKEETGWTPEDFLINFLTRLEETNQVSHDWNNYSAAWLLAAFFPQEGCVPDADWHRGYRRLYLGRGDPDDRVAAWGAPSTVRLTLTP